MRLPLGEVQLGLRARGLTGWLLYDFRGQNPIVIRALDLANVSLLTRRYFYYIPAEGMPVVVVHATEVERFSHVPGDVVRYSGWADLRDALARTLPSRGQVAMEYCAMGSNPYLSRVDAGTVELVKSYGPEVVTSSELVQSYLYRLSDAERSSHLRAAAALAVVKDDALAFVSSRLAKGELREMAVADEIARALALRGLVADGQSIVSAGVHTADPHFVPARDADGPIAEGDLVFLEIWAREPGGVYAQISWTALAGTTVPAEIRQRFAIVCSAQEKALDLLRARATSKKRVLGFEVDRAARDVVNRAGFGSAFVHRTGHPLSDTVSAGEAVTFDDLEIHDTREVVPGLAWAVHPGLYFEQYGLCTGVSVLLDEDGLVVTTPQQDEITTLR